MSTHNICFYGEVRKLLMRKMTNLELCTRPDRIWPGSFSMLKISLDNILGPVGQSIVNLTSSLVVKMLTVLVSTISNSQVFLLKKIRVAFANAKATHIFSAKILAYMPYLMIKVLMICYLMPSLVLNNWALKYFSYSFCKSEFAISCKLTP